VDHRILSLKRAEKEKEKKKLIYLLKQKFIFIKRNLKLIFCI
jgi:hypothetical protein